ncbi:MAG: FUN14 domain-containing protein [Deinococcales bacterium]
MQNPNLQTVFPFVEQLGFGAVAGFAAGFALKKVGKVVAIVVGLIFVVVQVLAYYGFVSINWAAVQHSVDPLLTPNALGSAWRSVLAVLTYNVAFAAAFVPSFVWGLKRG